MVAGVGWDGDGGEHAEQEGGDLGEAAAGGDFFGGCGVEGDLALGLFFGCGWEGCGFGVEVAGGLVAALCALEGAQVLVEGDDFVVPGVLAFCVEALDVGHAVGL